MAKKVEIDLFAFIRHSDPTKVRVRERNLAEREVKLLKMTEGRTVSLNPPVTVASGDSGDSIDKMFDEENDANQEHLAKKDDDVLEEVVALDTLEIGAEKAKKKRKRKVTRDASGSGSAIPSDATEPLVTASVTPVSDVGPVDSMSGLNLRTHPPHMRYVVSSDSSHHSGSYSEAASLVRSLAADVPVVTVAVTTTVDANVAAGSKAKDALKDFEHIGDSASVGGVDAGAANISKLKKPSISLDSFYASQSLDTETMHRVYVSRWKVTNDSVLDDPYAFRDMTDRLAPPALFTQLRAMDYDQLYSEFNVGATRQVEAADAAKSTELRDLKEKNFALEGERNVLSERVETLESVATSKEIELAFLSSQVAKLTADLSGFQLSYVAAFNPSAESDYVAAINALQGVSFSLLAQLEANKDASMADVMDLSCLEGSCLAESDIIVFKAFGGRNRSPLFLTDSHYPLVEPLSARNLTGEASSSAVLAIAVTITLLTTLAQTDLVPAMLSTKVPPSPKIVFEEEDLDTTPEHVPAP
ncbi:hypothetical protein Tco_0812377 [Tanacetum coccineum]